MKLPLWQKVEGKGVKESLVVAKNTSSIDETLLRESYRICATLYMPLTGGQYCSTDNKQIENNKMQEQ